jgi:oligopeptide transport system ATP-binding protein
MVATDSPYPSGASVRSVPEDGGSDAARPLVEARSLKVSFRARGARRGGPQWVRAVDDVSFSIDQGQVLGLVGETGSGKTTLGQILVGLVKVDEGQVLFQGEEVVTARIGRRSSLGRRIQMVFQESRGTLNPRMRVRDVIGEGLVIQKMGDREERMQRVHAIAARVGLNRQQLNGYPAELSGGQRQRIGIARALAVGPQFLVADEPVSGLDVSIQAQVLNLLLDLREEFSLTYLFISHDLAVVERISTQVAVMYMGKVMEYASVSELYSSPQVPYTYALLSARPAIHGQERYKRVVLPVGGSSLNDATTGCPFQPRCWMAQDVCRDVAPRLQEVQPGHWAACHFAGSV